MNVGSPTAPQLAPPSPLYNDGLELHGPWRVRPAVARLNGRMVRVPYPGVCLPSQVDVNLTRVCPTPLSQVYVMLDDSNELHAYYRTDDLNVKDAGKLKLRTGKPIGTHFLSGGATGKLGLRHWEVSWVSWVCDTGRLAGSGGFATLGG
jgi:hypothetical protein